MKTYYLLLATILAPLFSSVVINEYSASNLYDYVDNYQMKEDWIELYNTSNSNIDLGGYTLSDKIDNPYKWSIPGGTIIPANGYLTFWCSGRDESSGSHHHTNFTLKQTRDNPEHVVLASPEGDVINAYELFRTQLNHSMGRIPNGTGDFKIFTSPTKGEENDGLNYTGYAESIEFSIEPGFYYGTQELEFLHSNPDSNIRYTTDGDTPYFGSTQYTGPLTLNETQIIQAIVIPTDHNLLPSYLTFGTFFIDESHALPIISASANQLITMLNGNQTLRPHGTIEYFEDGERKDFGYGEYNKHGQDSWAFNQRSFDYIARDEMGYHYAVQRKLLSLSDRDEFQRLIIRASGDDNYPGIDSSAHMRDYFIQKVADKKKMNLDMRRGERCAVYANGQFWGVYSIREKVSDSDYTKFYYGQDKYNIQYVMNWGNTWAQYGGNDAINAWNSIRNYILSNNMAVQSNYDYAKSQLDITSLVDYVLINSFVVCTDWINWNTSVWRGLDPDGTHQKWGFVLWDEDATFNHYINYTGVPNEQPDAAPCYPEGINSDPLGVIDILNDLRASDEFEQYYITRYMDLLNTVFVEEEMIQLVDSIKTSIQLDMHQHIQRWGGSMDQWLNNVEKVKNFIRARIDHFPQGLNSCYGLTGPYDITLDVEPTHGGQVGINSLVIDSDEFPWTGKYHGGIEMKLNAVDNYEFEHWAFQNHAVMNPLSPNVIVALTQNDTITAVFENYENANIVINEINYNSLDTLFNPEDWIELYNPTNQIIDISSWQFKDEDDIHVFTIPENTSLSSGEYLVLCREEALFTSAFPEVSNYIGDFEFGLAGGGELLRLFNAEGAIIDSVDYNDSDPWPFEADGHGPTLELVDAMSDNTFADNWAASAGYGSPGRINSVSLLGDINEDGQLNILDIVHLVNTILSGEYNSAGDMNADGNNDVLDVVTLVNLVLGLNRVDDATIANVYFDGNQCRINGDGYIGAIQLTLKHEDDIEINLTKNALVSNQNTHGNETTIIIVKPEDDLLFETLHGFEIIDIVVANSHEYIEVNLPNEYYLSHAYPNPFNNSTSINFSIPTESHVSVKIYNLLGKEVASLVNETLDGGYHHLVWDAHNIASGIYFIQMSANNFVQTEKVILLK